MRVMAKVAVITRLMLVSHAGTLLVPAFARILLEPGASFVDVWFYINNHRMRNIILFNLLPFTVQERYLNLLQDFSRYFVIPSLKQTLSPE